MGDHEKETREEEEEEEEAASSGTRVVLITGGSSGIGAATALAFARQGLLVCITGRNQERLDSVLGQLRAAAGPNSERRFLAVRADFEQVQAPDQVILDTLAHFGRLDVVVNNAGMPGKRSSLLDSDFFLDFQRIIQVNLMAATRVAQLAAPHLVRTRGVLINVSSVADRVPNPQVSYSVAKAGLSMLTKSLANALDGTGVRVVTVAPGPVRSNFSSSTEAYAPLTSLGRVGEPSELAETILFLSSNRASFIHGCTIDVDGGLCSKYGNLYGQRYASTPQSTSQSAADVQP